MLSWFRTRTRSISSVALISLITLTVWSAAPHPDDCHETVCAAVAPHDPSSHSIGRTQHPSDPPIHCVLCHWTRWVRPIPEASPALAPAVSEAIGITVAVFRAPSQSSATQPPLRAPPVPPVAL